MKWKLFGQKEEEEVVVPEEYREYEVEEITEETAASPEPPSLPDTYEDVVARLIARTKDDAWILVPTKTMNGGIKYYERNMYKATSAEFATWLAFICPPLYKYAADVASFDEAKYRETVFDLVVEYARTIPEKWQHATQLATNFERGLS